MDLFFAGIPITVGASEAVHRQRLLDEEAEADERQEAFYLEVFCDAQSKKRYEVHDAIVVLRDGKVCIWPKDPDTLLPAKASEGDDAPHPFKGFYLPFPADDLPHRPIPHTPTLGLVSTVATSAPSSATSSSEQRSKSKPKLNWLYIDRQTRELRHGPRAQAKKHIVGPWNWTEDEEGLTLDGEESLVLVEEKSGGYGWAVYWDRDDDCLKDFGMLEKKRVLRCSLERRLVEEKEMKCLDED